MSFGFFRRFGWSNLGLRSRLTLAVGTVLLGFALVSQGIALHRGAADFRADMARDADRTLEALSLSVASYAASGDRAGIRGLLAQAVRQPSLRGLAWRAGDGGAPITAVDYPARTPAPAWFRALVDLPLPHRSRPVALGTREYGTLEAFFDPAPWETRLWRETRTQMAIATVALVALFAAIGLVLQTNLGLLARLPALARRFAGGDYDLREPVDPRLSPEVRALLASLNRVAEDMQATLRSMEGHRQALAEQLHFQRELLDAIPIPVYYKGRDGRYLGVNRAWENFFGRRADSIVGRPVFDLYPGRPDVAEVHHARDEQLWEQGGVQTYEIDIPVQGGQVRRTLYTKAVYRQADGRIAGIIGAINDITALREAEAVTQRFGRILDQSLNEIYLFDATTLRFTQVNLGARHNLGYSPDELLDMTPLDIKPRYDRASFEVLIAPLREGRADRLGFETVHRRRDGSEYPVRIRLQFFPEETPQLFVAVVEDISEQQRAEEALRESELRFRSMAAKVPGMVFQFALRARGELAFQFASEGARPLCGVAPADLLQDAERFLALLVAADRQRFLAGLGTSVRDLSPWNWEGRLIVAGDTKWINWRASPRRLGDGTVLWDGVAVNITETRTSQEALEASRRQLQALSDYLQTVREEEKAHIAREIHDELGGTLTALKMDAYWLARKLPEALVPLQEKLGGMLAMIDGAVQTTRRICTELRPTVLDDLGLVAAIEWQVAEFEKRMGIGCVFHRPAQDVELRAGMAVALFRILQESLTNVARHAEASRVYVMVQATDSHVCLAIEDDGRGIAPGAMEAGHSHGLRGIRERVRQFGGEVDIMGEPGKGTIVLVQLPLASAPQTSGPVEAQA